MKRALVFLLATVACGGSYEAAPSQAPSNTSPSGTSPAVPEGGAAHTSNTAEPPPPGIASARAEIDRDEQRIAAARSDCEEACRALASMERAADHLCALDSGAECTRVRERVEAARERVRTSCGECSR